MYPSSAEGHGLPSSICNGLAGGAAAVLQGRVAIPLASIIQGVAKRLQLLFHSCPLGGWLQLLLLPPILTESHPTDCCPVLSPRTRKPNPEVFSRWNNFKSRAEISFRSLHSPVFAFHHLSFSHSLWHQLGAAMGDSAPCPSCAVAAPAVGPAATKRWQWWHPALPEKCVIQRALQMLCLHLHVVLPNLLALDLLLYTQVMLFYLSPQAGMKIDSVWPFPPERNTDLGSHQPGQGVPDLSPTLLPCHHPASAGSIFAAAEPAPRDAFCILVSAAPAMDRSTWTKSRPLQQWLWTACPLRSPSCRAEAQCITRNPQGCCFY